MDANLYKKDFLERTDGTYNSQEIQLYLHYDCEQGAGFRFFLYKGVYALYMCVYSMETGKDLVLLITYTLTNGIEYGKALWELEDHYVTNNKRIACLLEEEENIDLEEVVHDIAEDRLLFRQKCEEYVDCEYIDLFIDGIEKEREQIDDYQTAVQSFFESSPYSQEYKDWGYIPEINNWK